MPHGQRGGGPLGFAASKGDCPLLKRFVSLLSGLSLGLVSTGAFAHIGTNGPVFAGKTVKVVFTVGHGCEGADTLSLAMQVPAGVTGVRPIPGGFGKASVVKDAMGNVTSVTWSRPETDLGASDDNAYEVALRVRIPDAPFTTLYFPTVQTCKSAAGVVSTASWVGTGGGDHQHGVDAGVAPAAPEPAPAVQVLPARMPGWNKYTLTQHVHDLPVFFSDAQIVWSGSAAWSPNPDIQALVPSEPNTTALTELHPGAVIWVRY
ncbi:MAG: DUF1775 domain-containing protein [Myxococcales bacterium]|nr:DUF1775 domain-containing protein [Myxococcales bacterium]